jgi:hypothetical protein
MRSAGNFHPEWGYLAPAPSFLRTARIVVVSTAVGATAGAAVVLSLVEPAMSPADTSVAGRALVMSAQAATPSTIPLADAAPAALVTAPVNALAAAPAEVPAAPTQLPAAVTVQAKAAPAVTNGVAPAAALDAAGGGTIETSPTSTPQAPASVAALAEEPPAAAPGQVSDETAAMPPASKKRTKTSRYMGYGPFQTVPARKSASNHRGFGPTLRRLFSARSSYYPYRGL